MAYRDLLVPNELTLYCGSITTSTSALDTVSMTFSGVWADPIVADVGFQKIGSTIYCIIPSIIGTATVSATIQSSNLPTAYTPTGTKYAASVISKANGVTGSGLCGISTKLVFGDDMAGDIFDTGANVGIMPHVISWEV